MTTTRGLVLPVSVRRAIVDHARRARPLECCGLLVGSAARVLFVMPMDNTARSAVRYRIDDRAHIDLRRALRGLRPAVQVVGVYHSHPAGDAWPSPTDVDEALYPEWVHIIVGLRGRRAVLRAFRIRGGRIREIALH